MDIDGKKINKRSLESVNKDNKRQKDDEDESDSEDEEMLEYEVLNDNGINECGNNMNNPLEDLGNKQTKKNDSENIITIHGDNKKPKVTTNEELMSLKLNIK